MANAALQFSGEPYDASGPRPMGRNAAGEGFLRGFLQHAEVERFHLWNVHGEDQGKLEALLRRLGAPDKPITWLARADRAGLAKAGAVHIPTPELKDEAWARRALGGHAYSITGVTHTIAETRILDEIGALLLAPLQPWDALVCTSTSVRNAVEVLLESVAAYLQERLGAARIPPAQLVTIPLGVHTCDFDANPGVRRRWRDELGISADAPVALFTGRFNLSTKMHPGPMGLALQETARRLGRPVYWLLYGGARRPTDEEAFRTAAAAFAPDVELRFVEHASARTRDEIASAADVFLSLSDNIQETFGLTPIEAMAAGLPCVVSDWDGYRDTVRHGIDGFRIRTTAPRPGLGSDLIYAYAQRLVSYDAYAAAASTFAAVDIGETAEALTSLFADPDLRHRMGQAARTRVREVFDWRAVIPQYQALWAELERRRAAAAAQPALENPYRPDPFRMFAAYPTAALSASDTVALAAPFDREAIVAVLGHPSAHADAARLPSLDEALQLLESLATGPRTVGALLAETSPERRPFIERGLVWLIKFGLLRLCGATPRT
ncbi:MULTISPECIES: glycosyltransferase family 4 protein [unclassified Phenylobacterium]|uniref:glycosyltransferase family 4 protein n=1 Tax=unclassified Phenylobacterium TaxID=2640670 RepID=UPI00083B704C|nr:MULTISPECIES: glycosyltransferase family 4 protein [unclassified Phenylobacterium]